MALEIKLRGAGCRAIKGQVSREKERRSSLKFGSSNPVPPAIFVQAQLTFAQKPYAGEHGRVFARLECSVLAPGHLSDQSSQETREAVLRPVVFHCNRKRFLLADQHHQLLSPRDPRVNKIALQEQVLLRRQGGDDCLKL